MMNKPADVDGYISLFPPAVKEKLETLRHVIQKATPGAEECISYGMPAYRFHGVLVYFAAYKNHIGFYPTGSGIAAFKKEFSGYRFSKGAVQFPLSEPLPLRLVGRMVRFRMKENLAKYRAGLKK